MILKSIYLPHIWIFFISHSKFSTHFHSLRTKTRVSIFNFSIWFYFLPFIFSAHEISCHLSDPIDYERRLASCYYVSTSYWLNGSWASEFSPILKFLSFYLYYPQIPVLVWLPFVFRSGFYVAQMTFCLFGQTLS